MIGFTQYSLQPQSHLDFKWTKLDLQVQHSFYGIYFDLVDKSYIDIWILVINDIVMSRPHALCTTLDVGPRIFSRRTLHGSCTAP